MSDTKKTLADALVEAQRAAKAVEKDAKNKFHNYAYASADAVVEEARGALAGAGLAVFALGWSIEPGHVETDRDGLVLVDDRKAPVRRPDRVRVTYRVAYGAESLDCPTESYIIPEKGRPDDKAEAGALTTNLSYFLRALLLLPREDETASVDQRDDRAHAPPQAQPSRAAPPRVAPDPAQANAVAKALIERAVAVAKADFEALVTDVNTAKRAQTIPGSGPTWDAVKKAVQAARERVYAQAAA